jgi:hypothetical protein
MSAQDARGPNEHENGAPPGENHIKKKLEGGGRPQAAMTDQKPYAIGIGRLPLPGNKPAIYPAISRNFLSD